MNPKPAPEYGVLTGFIQLDGGVERKISMHGHVEELLEVTVRIGLQPDWKQVQDLGDGIEVDLLFFSDGAGSYVTMQPVTEAAEFLKKTTR